MGLIPFLGIGHPASNSALDAARLYCGGWASAATGKILFLQAWTASASLVRIGLHDDLSGAPNDLIIDAGEVTGPAGNYAIANVDIDVVSSDYLHISAVCNTANALRRSNNGTVGNGRFKNFAYGPLPDPAGSGFTTYTANSWDFIALGYPVPSLSLVDGDNEITVGQTSCTIIGNNFVDDLGQPIFELADDPDYLLATVIVPQLNSSFTDTTGSFDVTLGDLIPGNTVYGFITTARGQRNSTGIAITLNPAGLDLEPAGSSASTESVYSTTNIFSCSGKTLGGSLYDTISITYSRGYSKGGEVFLTDLLSSAKTLSEAGLLFDTVLLDSLKSELRGGELTQGLDLEASKCGAGGGFILTTEVIFGAAARLYGGELTVPDSIDLGPAGSQLSPGFIYSTDFLNFLKGSIQGQSVYDSVLIKGSFASVSLYSLTPALTLGPSSVRAVCGDLFFETSVGKVREGLADAWDLGFQGRVSDIVDTSFNRILRQDLFRVFFAGKDFNDLCKYTHYKIAINKYYFVNFDDPSASNSVEGVNYSDPRPRMVMNAEAMIDRPRKGDKALVKGLSYEVEEMDQNGTGIYTVYLKKLMTVQSW